MENKDGKKASVLKRHDGPYHAAIYDGTESYGKHKHFSTENYDACCSWLFQNGCSCDDVEFEYR